MDVEQLWPRYAAIWSCDAARRTEELAICLSDDATYRDRFSARDGRDALSELMGLFQRDIPGGSFRITGVVTHNQRSLAHWELCGADGSILQRGASFATHADDGRLKDISGFFPLIVPEKQQ